jgi:hypothetical protein
MPWRVLREHLKACLFTQAYNAISERVGSVTGQKGRQQQHMPLRPRAYMPQTRITTEPRGGGLGDQSAYTFKPNLIKVLRLVQVDVEKVIGGRSSLRDPLEGVFIEAFIHFNTQF